MSLEASAAFGGLQHQLHTYCYHSTHSHAGPQGPAVLCLAVSGQSESVLCCSVRALHCVTYLSAAVQVTPWVAAACYAKGIV
jgi:hypothetical protein